jgi:UDP-glucose 4-epimerase
MKTILAVGGAGYIGFLMPLELQIAGCTVRVFDNLSRGQSDAVGINSIIQSDWSRMDHNLP